MKYFLAIDLGASSGRHAVGWRAGKQVQTREVYRFPNGPETVDGHLTWNLERLLFHVQAGIDRALEEFGKLESLSIDTWGVDYVLMDGKDPILPCYAYRDSRTEAVIPQVHEKIPFSELYRRTGIQFQPFNTLYQLYADLSAGRLARACGFLMMPEYLMYRLCGVKSHEYTNATTTGLVNAETGEYDGEILQALGLPKRLFKPLQRPGTVLGHYKGIRVVLCATHDTASAVEGIPMAGNDLYLSSGTWSLLGVKLPKPLTDENSRAGNYTNEGGPGYIRYLKNIMGMWPVNELRRELCPDAPFSQIVEMACTSRFSGLVDANDPAFLTPKSMKEAFDGALTGKKPSNAAGYFRCAYRSLALCYQTAVAEIERNTGASYPRLYIVGGGAKNAYLNRLTAQATGKQVIALPIEATAIGNLKIQMEANL